MSARALTAHLRRYPWWYALAAVWLVGMLALPTVRGGDVAAAFGGGGDTPGTTVGPAPAGGDAAPAGGPAFGGTGGAALGGGAVEGGAPTTVAPAPRSDGDEPDPLQLVPPEVLDAVFDALPPVVVPALPAELQPVFDAVAPVAATGCSGLGLAGVVVAVAAQTVQGVPFDRLLPYLAPASTACASFAVPKVHTVCASDEPLIVDLGGLTATPPILGLGIDELRGLEALLTSTYGIAVPSFADQLAEQLDCRLVG